MQKLFSTDIRHLPGPIFSKMVKRLEFRDFDISNNRMFNNDVGCCLNHLESCGVQNQLEFLMDVMFKSAKSENHKHGVDFAKMNPKNYYRNEAE